MTALSTIATALVTVGSSHLVVAQADPLSYAEGADPAAPLFDPLKIYRVDLTASANAVNAVNADTTHQTFQPGTVLISGNGLSMEPIDIAWRLKGYLGSFRTLDRKAAFKIKIDFDTAHKSQRLLGLKKLTLNNMVQDPTMAHEATAYKMFREMNIPAPRVGYARVYLNGIDYGLHAIVETVDSAMLKRWFPVTSHLYEGTMPQDLVLPIKLQHDIGAKTSDTLITAVAEASKLTGITWWNRFKTLVDVNEVTRMWATEVYIGHWDGYGVGRNNYYVHFDGDGKMRLLPWGTDMTFENTVSLRSPLIKGTLLKKCFTVTACKTMYLNALDQVQMTSDRINLQNYMQTIHASIRSELESDTRKEFSNTAATTGLSTAVQFLDGRSAQVIATAKTYVHGAMTVIIDPAYRTPRLLWTPKSAPQVTPLYYQIQISSNGTNWVNWKSTTSTGYFLTGFSAKSTRYFRVRVITNLGTGSWTKIVKVKFA